MDGNRSWTCVGMYPSDDINYIIILNICLPCLEYSMPLHWYNVDCLTHWRKLFLFCLSDSGQVKPLNAFRWFIEIYQWNKRLIFHSLKQLNYQFDIFDCFVMLHCFSEKQSVHSTANQLNDVMSLCIIIWWAFQLVLG
jgi:hypothetical protein